MSQIRYIDKTLEQLNEVGLYTKQQICNLVIENSDREALSIGKLNRDIQKYSMYSFVESKAHIIGTKKPCDMLSLDITKALYGVEIKPSMDAKIQEVTSPAPRKGRDDLNLLRKPAGFKQSSRNKLEKWLRARSFELYMAQAFLKNKRESVHKAVEEWLFKNPLPSDWKTAHQMGEYFYNQRCCKKNKFAGWSNIDNWVMFHKKRWDAKKDQRTISTLSYDYFSLFYNDSVKSKIGPGFGAGQIWFIDGTGFDSWVDLGGKKTKINFMMVICGFTGEVIAKRPIASENTQDVINLVLDAYQKVGTPRYGMVVDNSSAFRSKKFKSFVKSLYSDHDMLYFREDPFFRKLFPNQPDVPLLYPMPNCPTSIFKGKGERAIKEIKRGFGQIPSLAKSWQADKNRRVFAEPGESLKYLFDNAVSADKAWDDLELFINADYRTRTRIQQFRSAMKIARENGSSIEPTISSVWDFFGGNDPANFLEFPEENFWKIFYYQTPDQIGNTVIKHKIRSKNLINDLSIKVTHDKIPREYRSHLWQPGEFAGKHIDVIPDPNDDSIAYLFLVHGGIPDERIQNEHDVYFIGPAQDNLVRSIGDLSKRKYSRLVREKQQQLKERVIEELEIAEAQNTTRVDVYHNILEGKVEGIEKIKEIQLAKELPRELPESKIEMPEEDIHIKKEKEIKQKKKSKKLTAEE